MKKYRVRLGGNTYPFVIDRKVLGIFWVSTHWVYKSLEEAQKTVDFLNNQ